MNTKRLTDYIRRNGAASTWYAIRQHLSDDIKDRAYDREMKSRSLDETELTRQRGRRFPYEPLISILVPTYKPEDKYFREMLRSVRNQTYDRYELLLGNGGGISENTNAALSQASGDYIALLDQDDWIEPDTLYRVVCEINTGARLVYTDEDKYDADRDRYLRPFRKHEFDLELLLSNNYVCHFLVADRKLAEEIGGFRSDYDGAQDHDFVLRCVEKLDRTQIAHVDKILYHWRIHKGSTAGDPSEKDYAHLAGKGAIEDYLRRNDKEAEVIETEHRGFYRAKYMPDENLSGSPIDYGYKLHLGDGIKPGKAGLECEMFSFLNANPDVGAIGGRVIDRLGRIVSGGYNLDHEGNVKALYQGMNHRLSGEFHEASLRQEVDIISNKCVMLRPELEDCMDKDSARMSRRIRGRGYRIIMDPQMVFVL